MRPSGSAIVSRAADPRRGRRSSTCSPPRRPRTHQVAKTIDRRLCHRRRRSVLARVSPTIAGGIASAERLLSQQPSPPPQSRTGCLSSDGGADPGRHVPGGPGRSAGVRRKDLVTERQLAVNDAEFEFRVGDDDAALEGPWSAARLIGGEARWRGLGSCQAPRPIRVGTRASKEMFSSWPSVALVEGVKTGSGRRSASRRPAGSGADRASCRRSCTPATPNR